MLWKMSLGSDTFTSPWSRHASPSRKRLYIPLLSHSHSVYIKTWSENSVSVKWHFVIWVAVHDVSKDLAPLKQEPLAQIAQGHLPEDGNLQQYRFENLRSCTIIYVGNKSFCLCSWDRGGWRAVTKWAQSETTWVPSCQSSLGLFHGLSIGNIYTQ